VNDLAMEDALLQTSTWQRQPQPVDPLRDADEIRDTIEAYEYLAEWEAGEHRGDDGYDAEPILRLKRGDCVRGGVRIR
jgi:hypothetical protein